MPIQSTLEICLEKTRNSCKTSRSIIKKESAKEAGTLTVVESFEVENDSSTTAING